VSKALTKVNSLGSNSGPLIALPSPYAHFETGLRMCPPEKSLDNDCIRCRGVRSPQSGLSGNNREIRALLAYLGAERAEFGREFDNFTLLALVYDDSGMSTWRWTCPLGRNEISWNCRIRLSIDESDKSTGRTYCDLSSRCAITL